MGLGGGLAKAPHTPYYGVGGALLNKGFARTPRPRAGMRITGSGFFHEKENTYSRILWLTSVLNGVIILL